MRIELIYNVPNGEVAPTKGDFTNAGALTVVVADNGDGTSKITATFPADLDGGRDNMRTETLKNVPNAQVDQVKGDFTNAGATSVAVKDNGDGTSDVTATFAN